MNAVERAHRATADLRAALHEAYEAADRLCTVFMRVKNGASDQSAIDKATRRVYTALRALEQETYDFNALCVRIREGEIVKDGNGTPLDFAKPSPDDGGGSGSAA